ncbi:hypothetical protein J2X55_003387 [Microbacterium sp. 1154]|uniref:hypothetical protein n=1 Tax=Microbacterium sp. 1154 TaxID=2817733 RepID=UPI002863952F|nr:hypothetical protein [Microbacterium sp. 1154]MDR6692443.1 hypothetical protein [Microbacterium sp. 1154]
MTTPSAPNGPAFAAPHAAPPVGTLLTPPKPTRRGRPLGAWALILSVVAAVLASAVGGFAAFRSARGAAPGLSTMSSNSFDWRVLSPVRDLVLLGEVAFWSGTVIGLTALTLGIIAIVRRSGRGAGIAGLVIAALGPAVFGGFTLIAIVAGLASAPTAGSSV